MPDFWQSVDDAKHDLPAPLKRALGSTGVNVVEAPPHRTGGAYGDNQAIATVDVDSPDTVAVTDPDKFSRYAPQTLAHESTHLLLNNLAPGTKKVPPNNPKDPYDYGGPQRLAQLRQQGVKLYNLPQEEAATIVQYYQSQGGKNAPQRIQDAYGPWVQDINSAPLSTILPTKPGQEGIGMDPRPPQAEPQTYQAKDTFDQGDPAPGDIPAKWKKLNPQQRDLALSRMSPEQKQKLATSLGFKGEKAATPEPKALAPKARTVGNYAGEIARGVGRGVADDVTGLYQTARHPIDTATGLVKQAGTATTEAGKEFRDTAGAPIGQRLGAAALTGLENAPMVGGMVQHAEQGGERMGSPEAAGAAAEGITAFAAPEVAGKAIGLAPRAVEAVTGTGTRAVRDLVKDTQKENSGIADKNAKQVADRVAEVQAHGDKVAAAKQAADQRAALATRKSALETGVRTLSDKFKDDLKATRDKAKDDADAKYTAVNKVLREKTIPSHSLLGHLLDAQTKIKGSMTDPAIFKDIEKNIKGDKNSTGRDVIPYDDLQGYYSELGRELSKGTLPGDIYTAYSTLQDAIGQEMQGVADKNNLGPQLTDARNSWRNLKQTFYDPKSPLRKALNTKEAGDAISELAGKDRTGIEALAKYDPQLARRANVIRGYADEAKGIRVPGESTKAAPELGPRKAPTPATKIGEENIQEAKAGKLQKRADLIRDIGTRSAVWPAIIAMRTLLRGSAPGLAEVGGEMIAGPLIGHGIAGILEKPAVKEFLTKATARDIAAIPEDLRGDMPSVVKAAQKKGIKVSPLLVRATQGTAFLAPRKEPNPTDAWAGSQQ